MDLLNIKQKCEVQEQSYVPSPESFKVYLQRECLAN
jgi:hypothetical protein